MSQAWTAGLWAERPALNLDLIWATLGFVALVLVGALAIAWVNRWWRGLKAPEAPAAELEQYRVLFEQGVLNAEEYERIRSRLEGIARPRPRPGQEDDPASAEAIPGSRKPSLDGFREGMPDKPTNP